MRQRAEYRSVNQCGGTPVPARVTARFCSFCGQSILPKATVCTSCGASLAGNVFQGGGQKALEPSIPSVTPIRQNLPLPPLGREKTSDDSADDRYALTRVTAAAILGLLGVLVGLAALFALASASIVGLGILILVSAILTFLELIAFRGAFITLEYHDPRFSNPAKLVLLLLAVVPLLLITLVAFVWVVYQAGSCGRFSNPPGLPCTDQGTALIVVAALGVLGIAAFVGILGLLIGIWRLGTRYNSATFKLAAVLFPLPVLNVVAMILLLVCATSTRARIAAEASAPSPG